MIFARGTFIFFFAIVHCNSFAQGVAIQGIILDDSTKLPIDYAQIFISDPANNYWVSTVSSLEGSFTILVPSKYLNDTLHVSLVGFESIKLPISGLKTGKDAVIYLHQSTIVLPTIVVRALTAMEVISKGLENVAKNYSNTFFLNSCYYWRSIKADSVYTSLVQGNLVIEESLRGNHLERKITKDPALNSAPNEAVIFLDSAENLFYFDFLRAYSGLMNVENIGEWVFAFSDGEILPEGYLIIEGKRMDNFMTVKVLMNENDYSFSRIDYSYNWKEGKFNNLPGTLAYSLKSLEGRVIYGKNRGKYNLKYLSMQVSYQIFKKRGFQTYNKKFDREIKHELVVLSTLESSAKPRSERTQSFLEEESAPVIINTKDYCEAAEALGIGNEICR